MNESSLDMLPPENLARLLDIAEETQWSAADAAAALAHQLKTPLLPDLLSTPGAEGERLKRLSVGGVSLERATFSAALTDSQTTLDLLQAIKAWAKHIRKMPSHPLSGGPATVLYYAAIAAAMGRVPHAELTQLSSAELREGFAWSQAQQGAEPLRKLFSNALELQWPQR